VTTNDQSTSYAYDGLGRRTSTTTTDAAGQYTSSSVFDGLTPLASTTTGETHGQTTGDDWDIWVRDALGGQLIESATALTNTTDGPDRWALLDNLGSLIAQAPAAGANTGTITQSMGWSAFGIPQPATTGWDNTQGYTGQTTDLTQTQIQFHARILDPITAGWTSTDTWAGHLTQPATLNTHTYLTCLRFPGRFRCGDHAASGAAVWRSS
jgi:YD repeat-containing protein